MSRARLSEVKRCKERVHNPGTTVFFHRCPFRVVRDGYCKVHHPDSYEQRREKSDMLWHARRKRDPLFLAHQEIKRLNKRIRELQKELRQVNERHRHRH